MTELLRPSLYGSQHPLVVVPSGGSSTAAMEEARYVVVGHCCESGDLVSPADGEPETITERPMGKAQVSGRAQGNQVRKTARLLDQRIVELKKDGYLRIRFSAHAWFLYPKYGDL